MIKRAKVSIYSIVGLMIVYIGLSSIFPPIVGYFGSTDTIIKIIFNFLMLLVALRYQGKCFISSSHVLLVLVFILYSTLVPYVAGNPVWANRYLDIMFFLTAPLMVSFLNNASRDNDLNKIALIVLVFGMITLLNTSTALLTSPYLSRSIKSSGETTTIIKKSGIGGYEFVYFIVLLGVAFFYCFWNYRRIMYLLISITCILFVFLSNYMTAVLLFGVGCLIALFSGRNIKQRIFAAILILLVIAFSRVLINWVLDFITVLSPNGRISRLLAGNSSGIIQTISEEFVIDRFPTIKSSLEVIRRGNGLGILFSSSSEVLRILGQHSHLLDTFAILGIPAGIVYFYLVFKTTRLPACCLITFILLLIFNNVTNSIAVAVYVLDPVIIGYAKRKIEEKREPK